VDIQCLKTSSSTQLHLHTYSHVHFNSHSLHCRSKIYWFMPPGLPARGLSCNPTKHRKKLKSWREMHRKTKKRSVSKIHRVLSKYEHTSFLYHSIQQADEWKLIYKDELSIVAIFFHLFTWDFSVRLSWVNLFWANTGQLISLRL
jgi:hypothetical protein